MRFLFLFALLATSVAFARPGGDDSFPVSNTNPHGRRDFPEGRGENQLIVDTRAFGELRTGTNEWGVEAVVNNKGIVVSVGGNNSRIPSNGFVLSAHGTAKDWLLQHVNIGARVAVKDGKVSVRYDASSFLYLAANRGIVLRKRLRLHGAWLTAGEKKQVRRIFGKLDSVVAICRSISAPDSGIGFFTSGTMLLDELDYRITPSRASERRGVWHRPIERTAAQIDSTVGRFARAGFNMMFVETIWSGETIYPGRCADQKKQFVGFDPLRAFLDAGRRHGVAIHAWVHAFVVGAASQENGEEMGPILAKHPDWVLVKRNGEEVSRAENGSRWVCPARPEVQEFIASLCREIATTYPDIAGIQLDDVRYPVNSSLEESSCYCDFCRASFRRIAGIDPLSISSEGNPREWARWQRWREENIARFVRRVRRENPRVILSASVFPDIEETRRTTMQNWRAWVSKHDLNFLVPMIYTTSVQSLTESFRKVRVAAGTGCPVYAGLAPFMRLTPELLLREIGEARNLHASGLVFFASHSFSDRQLALLAAGPFRNKRTR